MKQRIKLIIIMIFAISLLMAACALANDSGLITRPFSASEIYKTIAKMFSKTKDFSKNKKKKQDKEEEELISFLV